MSLVATILTLALAAGSPPQRIVSCVLASDETLVHLLTRKGQMSRLVAVSTLADDARLSHAAPVPKEIKGRCGGELESVLVLKPDVAVIASYSNGDMRRRLEQAGVRTSVLEEFRGLDDLEAHVQALGKLTGTEAEAQAIVREIHERRAKVAKAPVTLPGGGRPKLLHVFPDGAVSGVGTLFDDLTKAVGGVNALAPLGVKGWPHLGAEAVATLKADYVVMGADESERGTLLAMLRGQAGLKELEAVKKGRLLLVPEKDIGAASEYLVNGLEELRDRLAAAVAKDFGKGAGKRASAR